VTTIAVLRRAGSLQRLGKVRLPHWQARIAPDGHPEYLPPTHIDPTRQSRRNLFHHRT
jgi:hypothetical protein